MSKTMKHFYEVDGCNENGYLIFKAIPGHTIDDSIREAIEWTKHTNGMPIAFDFNGVRVNIKRDSDYDLLLRDWYRATSGYIDKNIGPYPSKVLHYEEQKHDARVRAENERRWKEQEEQYQKKMESKKAVLEEKIRDISMEVVDENLWSRYVENNKNPYGARTISYAEEWARLMQFEMSQGNSLEDIAEQTSHDADYDGITGFMYGCAVSILSQCWKHGEQIRHWHNLDS